MDLLDRFEVAFDVLRQGDGAPELMPTQLSRAVARALGAQGAGISLVAEIRVPLGWSNDETRVAEALQTTLGQGPCLTAVAEGRLLVADEPSLRHRWPHFADLVLRRTSFRSVASLPLLLSPELHGAIDAYWTTGDAEDVDQGEAFLLAGRVGEMLIESPGNGRSTALEPDWLGGQIPQRRLRLWTATGLVSADLVMEPSAAVAAIRGWALEHELLLDDVVDRLVSRTLAPRDLVWEDGG